MDSRRTLRGPLAAIAVMAVTQACVDPFTGGFVFLDLNSQINESLLDAQTGAVDGTGRPVFGARLGGVTGPAEPEILAQHADLAVFSSQPPANTHFQLNYVRNSVDEDGNQVAYTFKALDFELAPQVNLGDPCLMDIEPTSFPGIHSTAVQARTAEEYGFATPTDPSTIGPSDPVWDSLTEDELARVFHEARRHNLVLGFSGRLLSVVSHHAGSPAQDIGIDTVCADDPSSDPGLIPPHLDFAQFALGNIVPVCFDDESNARRKELCESYFDAEDQDGNPINGNYYVGSDRILTKPVNGTFFGSVYSLDPRNPLGVTRFIGSILKVDEDIGDADSLVVAWQFDDADGDGDPDYPDTFPDDQKSPTGVTYLSGQVSNGLDQRGVATFNLRNISFSDPFLNGRATIYENLDEDEVNF